MFLENKESLIVGVGDCKVSQDLNKTLKTFALGSCIGVVIYSPIKQIAGLLHFALPNSQLNATIAKQQPAMFADTGMQFLLSEFSKFGGNPWNSWVKIAGGNNVLDDNGQFAIGEKNTKAIYEIIEMQNLKLLNADLGGMNFSRTLTVDIATGNITVYSPKLGSWEL